MGNYDSWKTTEPVRKPGPAEHRADDPECMCDECAPAREQRPADTRPRYLYRLPDGRTIRVIHDHGETPKDEITYDLGKGQIVIAKRCGYIAERAPHGFTEEKKNV